MATVGIDLGTTNSLVSVWQDDKCTLIPNNLGEYLTPSAAALAGRAAADGRRIRRRSHGKFPREKDEKSEESATQSVEPPEQPKDDSEAWESDWTRQFQNMADASERQGADDREVRKKSWSSASVCI